MNKQEKISMQIKQENPEFWCTKALEVIQARVAEYNQVAETTIGAEVIVAFSMTKAERKEFLENIEIIEEGDEDGGDEAGDTDTVVDTEEDAGEEADADRE